MGNHACITAETSHTGFVLESLAFSDRNSFDNDGCSASQAHWGGDNVQEGDEEKQED